MAAFLLLMHMHTHTSKSILTLVWLFYVSLHSFLYKLKLYILISRALDTCTTSTPKCSNVQSLELAPPLCWDKPYPQVQHTRPSARARI